MTGKLALSAAAIVAITGAVVFFNACGGGEEPGEVRATEPVSIKIEEFTGGHTKLVWSRHVGGGSSDVHLSYTKHQLWGIDTRDGKGIRQILETTANYGRPLIAPNGESIIWTNKGTEDAGTEKDGKPEKKFNPVIFQAAWDGSETKELGKGYAVDVWRDPETGTDWVYAAILGKTHRASLFADRLERFPIGKPEERELLWDKTRLSTENIQLSRDGKRASALFPWPDAGVLDLEKTENRINNHGCWPSLAPDNSYRAWVFDGAHKNLRMFDARGERQGRVALNEAPGIDGHEVYHPRWSNHVSFLTMTGPYKGATVSKSPSKEVEVFIGRFNRKFDGIESWLQVTDDAGADFFPDFWIAHGVTGNGDPLAGSPGQGDPPEGQETKKRAWPVTGGRLLFLWENRKTDNLVDRGARKASVIARDQARYGRHDDMLCDGGYFDADAETSTALNAHFGLNRFKFTVELLATPFSADQNGVLLSTRAFQILQQGDDLILVSTRPAPSAFWFGKAEPGVPVHLGVIFDGREFRIFHNGEIVSQEGRNPQPEMPAAREGLTFGEGWAGALEGISIVPGELDDFRVERGAKYLLAKLGGRQPVPRVRLKAKLLHMTPDRPVGELDTYRRALLGYLYEVEEVLEGEFQDDRVLVLHWTILDRKPVQSFPRRPGRSYELLIEPIIDGPKTYHPELESERQWNDIPDLLNPWYDVDTPQD